MRTFAELYAHVPNLTLYTMRDEFAVICLVEPARAARGDVFVHVEGTGFVQASDESWLPSKRGFLSMLQVGDTTVRLEYSREDGVFMLNGFACAPLTRADYSKWGDKPLTLLTFNLVEQLARDHNKGAKLALVNMSPLFWSGREVRLFVSIPGPEAQERKLLLVQGVRPEHRVDSGALVVTDGKFEWIGLPWQLIQGSPDWPNITVGDRPQLLLDFLKGRSTKLVPINLVLYQPQLDSTKRILTI